MNGAYQPEDSVLDCLNDLRKRIDYLTERVESLLVGDGSTIDNSDSRIHEIIDAEKVVE